MMSDTFVTLGSSRFKNVSVSETPRPPNYPTHHNCTPAWPVPSSHINHISFWLPGWVQETNGNAEVLSSTLGGGGGEESGSQEEAQANFTPITKRSLPLSPHTNHIPILSVISTSEGQVLVDILPSRQTYRQTRNTSSPCFSQELKGKTRQGEEWDKRAGWIINDAKSPQQYAFVTGTNIGQTRQIIWPVLSRLKKYFLTS